MKSNVIQHAVTSLISGVLFGFGLCLSDMINPARVLAFLDITGNWDPTLLFVMSGALLVTVPGYYFILSRPQPLFEQSFSITKNSKIDRPLILGAVLFGAGWGLIGLCPGPAISGLMLGQKEIWLFVVAMFVGFYLHDFYKQLTDKQ